MLLAYHNFFVIGFFSLNTSDFENLGTWLNNKRVRAERIDAILTKQSGKVR